MVEITEKKIYIIINHYKKSNNDTRHLFHKFSGLDVDEDGMNQFVGDKSRVKQNVPLAKVGDRVDEIFRMMSIRGIDCVIAHMWMCNDPLGSAQV